MMVHLWPGFVYLSGVLSVAHGWGRWASYVPDLLTGMGPTAGQMSLLTYSVTKNTSLFLACELRVVT